MKAGKLPNDVLKKIILDKLKKTRTDILVRPGIGEDCCAIDFGENICLLSTDPITGAVNEIGRLAVHISCNDIASCGVEPLGLLITILAPVDTTVKDIEAIMDQITHETASLNVEVIGGHTEITEAVNRCVIVCTAIGKVLKNRMVTTSGARPGDDVVMTKSAGLEGTSIIAHDKEAYLAEKLGTALVERAKTFIDRISVVKEGVIAGKYGVNSMHDATEGGILGAVWEIAEASGVGVRIYRERIPIEPETLEISRLFEIDPLKLISSGCMVITCPDGEGLVNELKRNGIDASIIGKVTGCKDKKLISESHVEDILQPGSDELYKAI